MVSLVNNYNSVQLVAPISDNNNEIFATTNANSFLDPSKFVQKDPNAGVIGLLKQIKKQYKLSRSAIDPAQKKIYEEAGDKCFNILRTQDVKIAYQVFHMAWEMAVEKMKENCSYNFGEVAYTKGMPEEKIEVLSRCIVYFKESRANMTNREISQLKSEHLREINQLKSEYLGIIDKYKVSLEASCVKNEKLEIDKKALDDANKNLRAEISRLMTKVADQYQEIIVLQRKDQEHLQNVERLTTQLNEQLQTMQGLRGQIQSKDEQISQLNTMLNTVRTQVRSEIDRLTQEQNVSSELRTRLNRVESILESTKILKQMSENQVKELKDELEVVKKELTSQEFYTGVGTGAALGMSATALTGVGLFLVPLGGIIGAFIGGVGATAHNFFKNGS